MKPRRITSLKDLEDTINWRMKQYPTNVDYETFVTCLQLGVSTSAIMKLFHTKNAKTVENWKRHYYKHSKSGTIQL